MLVCDDPTCCHCEDITIPPLIPESLKGYVFEADDDATCRDNYIYIEEFWIDNFLDD